MRSKKTRIARRKKHRGKLGASPGDFSLDPNTPKPTISVVAYDEKQLLEPTDCHLGDLPSMLENHRVTWVNIDGLGDRRFLEEIARIFHLHPLALEDIVNVPQRPKVESYEDHLFVVVQMLSWKESTRLEQMSLCLGSRFVLTFQERPGDPFEPVRQRLHNSGKRLRENGPDYLAYALIDAVIDHYFPVLESVVDHLEDLEAALRSPLPDALDRIQAARFVLREARRAVGPLRDVTRSLVSGEWPLITDTTRVYLRDCHDHVLEASEIMDSCREIGSSLIDIHFSTVSHQANHTMKLLTMIATIFMPLSFLAGIYGMNFDTQVSSWNMPELGSPIGYPVLLGIMGVVGLGLAVFFWRKGWFD